MVEYSFEDSDMAIAVTDLITEVYPPDPVQGWFVSSMALANFVMGKNYFGIHYVTFHLGSIVSCRSQIIR